MFSILDFRKITTGIITIFDFGFADFVFLQKHFFDHEFLMKINKLFYKSQCFLPKIPKTWFVRASTGHTRSVRVMLLQSPRLNIALRILGSKPLYSHCEFQGTWLLEDRQKPSEGVRRCSRVQTSLEWSNSNNESIKSVNQFWEKKRQAGKKNITLIGKSSPEWDDVMNSSELCPLKEHHVEGILKSELCVILQIYNRKSNYEKI